MTTKDNTSFVPATNKNVTEDSELTPATGLIQNLNNSADGGQSEKKKENSPPEKRNKEVPSKAERAMQKNLSAEKTTESIPLSRSENLDSYAQPVDKSAAKNRDDVSQVRQAAARNTISYGSGEIQGDDIGGATGLNKSGNFDRVSTDIKRN